MSDSPRGCLLLALPAALFGGARAALPGPALPVLDHRKMHPQDLPALVEARRAAEGASKRLASSRAKVADHVIDEVAAHLGRLLGQVYAIGERLAEARRFVEEHAPQRLAKERAELELEQLGAAADRLVELKRHLASLERRASHVGRIEVEIGKLSSRLGAAAAELRELEAKLVATLGSEALLHELRAYELAASSALEAFAGTWREVAQ